MWTSSRLFAVITSCATSGVVIGHDAEQGRHIVRSIPSMAVQAEPLIV